MLPTSELDPLPASESDSLPVCGIALLIASGREMPIGLMCATSGAILGRK